MLINFTAQNFENESYKALDFQGANAFLYYSLSNNDINLLKRFIQLLWGNSIEDDVNIPLILSNTHHLLKANEGKIYFDDIQVDTIKLQSIYNINLSNYSKLYPITYTQLLNLELSRTNPESYLNHYLFKKVNNKSYYSPLEDIFYEIEQNLKYIPGYKSESEEQKLQNILEIKQKITDLESIRSNGTIDIQDKILSIENQLIKTNEYNIYLQSLEEKKKKASETSQLIDEYKQELQKITTLETNTVNYDRLSHIDTSIVEKDLSTFTFKIRQREKTLSEVLNANSKNIYKENTTKTSFLPIIVLSTIILAAGISFTIIINTMLFLYIAFVFVGIGIAMLVLFNFDKKHQEKNYLPNIDGIKQEIQMLKNAKTKYLQSIGFNSEEDYFAAKSVLRAMIYEKESDINLIHQKFGGREISDFELDLMHINSDINELNEKISTYTNILNSDEFKNKKRELEQLRLDSTVHSNTDVNIQIENLKKQLIELEKSNNNSSVIKGFLQILSQYYSSTITVDSEFNVKGVKIESYDDKVELFIMQRLAYIITKYPFVELPIYLEDPFVGVNNKDKIRKILDFCSQKLQTIVISEHEEYTNLGLKLLNTL